MVSGRYSWRFVLVGKKGKKKYVAGSRETNKKFNFKYRRFNRKRNRINFNHISR